MFTQSEKERQKVVGSTQELEPARDNSPVVSNTDSEIHIDIDDLEELDRNREKDQASTNQTEKTMKQNNHTALTDVHPQKQPGSTAASAVCAIREVEWGPRSDE